MAEAYSLSFVVEVCPLSLRPFGFSKGSQELPLSFSSLHPTLEAGALQPSPEWPALLVFIVERSYSYAVALLAQGVLLVQLNMSGSE